MYSRMCGARPRREGQWLLVPAFRSRGPPARACQLRRDDSPTYASAAARRLWGLRPSSYTPHSPWSPHARHDPVTTPVPAFWWSPLPPRARTSHMSRFGCGCGCPLLDSALLASHLSRALSPSGVREVKQHERSRHCPPNMGRNLCSHSCHCAAAPGSRTQSRPGTLMQKVKSFRSSGLSR